MLAVRAVVVVGGTVAGLVTAHAASEVFARRRAERQSVRAVVLNDVPRIATVPGGTTGRRMAAVRRTTPDGSPRTDRILVTAGLEAGSKAVVWQDGEGRLVPRADGSDSGGGRVGCPGYRGRKPSCAAEWPFAVPEKDRATWEARRCSSWRTCCVRGGRSTGRCRCSKTSFCSPRFRPCSTTPPVPRRSWWARAPARGGAKPQGFSSTRPRGRLPWCRDGRPLGGDGTGPDTRLVAGVGADPIGRFLPLPLQGFSGAPGPVGDLGQVDAVFADPGMVAGADVGHL